ncbi:MAG: CPA1 family monovalent cation:H+ antiporter [Cellvibrionaceae bacterium]|jgi:CPA1 family monovalent cation:H+ antiporter
MELLNIIALLITLAAGFNYLNYRFIGLPTTIGIMAIALIVSLLVLVSGLFGFGAVMAAQTFVGSIDFNATLMQGMLSFLLFASALHVNLNDLVKQMGPILLLASVGIIFSTTVVGFASWYVLQWLGIDLPFIYCMLFGALISPTDPIAVMNILKTAGAPKTLETKIVGESLFNDGVAVVVFIVLLGILSGGGEISGSEIAFIFLEEAIGGIVFGLGLGFVGYRLLSTIDNYQLEIMITLAVVMGGYSMASALHLSGPLAMVMAGLLIGNHGRLFAMSDTTREHVDQTWHLIDEILNAILFLLIGIELLAITLSWSYLVAGLIMIVVTLVTRFVSVGSLITLMRRKRTFSPGVVKILTWGGLRGGISVALALSLPAGPERAQILTITYVIVVFSILVQGLTVGRLIESTQQTQTPELEVDAG